MTNAPPRLSPSGRLVRSDELPSWNDAAQALREAELIEERGKRQAASARRAAEEQGYLKGYERGAADVARLVSEAGRTIETYYGELERELPRLACAVAKQLIDALPPEDAIVGMVRQVVASLDRPRELTLHVSPALVRGVAERYVAPSDPGWPSLRIAPDPGLQNDEAILSGSFGSIDLSADERLDLVLEALARELTGPREPGAGALSS